MNAKPNVKPIAWTFGHSRSNSVDVSSYDTVIIESEKGEGHVEIPADDVQDLMEALKEANNILEETRSERRQSTDDSNSRY